MNEKRPPAVVGISILASSVVVAAATAPTTKTAAAPTTKTLAPEARARAEAFMEGAARPIDRYRFELSFRNGDPGRVLAELARYQNPDGGFGRALEPDLRCIASSAPATVDGLTIAGEAGAGPDHPLVQAATRYLVSSFDSRKGYWSAVPPEVTTAPHAHWWHPDPEARKAPAETPAYPTAAILALFHRYRESVPAELLDRATDNLVGRLAEMPDKMDPGAVLALLRLAAQVPEPRPAVLIGKATRAAAASVARNRRDWTRYVLSPVLVVDSPDSPLYRGLQPEVDDNLAFLLETQDADGGWSPTWSWEKSDPKAWAQARHEWRGVLTLENLRRLRAFGRLSSVS